MDLEKLESNLIKGELEKNLSQDTVKEDALKIENAAHSNAIRLSNKEKDDVIESMRNSGYNSENENRIYTDNINFLGLVNYVSGKNKKSK